MGEIIVNGSIYWDTQEVIDYLLKTGGNGSTRESVRTGFYRDVRGKLYTYNFYGKSKPWYRKSEVEALSEGHPEEPHHIIIRGLLTHWTHYAESLGLNVDTINCEIEVGVSLPIEVCTQFHIPEQSVFVRRKRLTFIDRVPICFWTTFYPYNLVASFLDHIKEEPDFDIPAAISASRGLRAAPVMDSIRAREASIPEQELLQLSRPDTIINLQRATRSEQGVLMWFSDMTLLASWFCPTYSYTLNEE